MSTAETRTRVIIIIIIIIADDQKPKATARSLTTNTTPKYICETTRVGVLGFETTVQTFEELFIFPTVLQTEQNAQHTNKSLWVF